MREPFTSLPQQFQHLWQCYFSALVQFLIGDAIDGVQDYSDGVAVHAEGLRGFARGGDDQCFPVEYTAISW
jgi:hypothetical protein